MSLNYKENFLTSDFYTKEYNNGLGSPFKNQFLAQSPEDQAKWLSLASTRIKRLADRPWIDVSDLEIEQEEGVKVAASRMLDYWMEYGLDLNRISGSVSLGTFSASQTAPNDPDYIPESVYETLQDVNLYTPVGYIVESDIARPDQDEQITYGVRFKNLERVKDIEIVYAVDEVVGKDISLDTSKQVDAKIKLAQLSSIEFLGQFTTNLLTNLTQNFDTFLKAQTISPTNGDTAQIRLENATGDDAVYNGLVETYQYNGTSWVRETRQYETLTKIAQLNNTLNTLTGSSPSRAITGTEGDLRYIKTDGSNEMSSTYVPQNNKSVVVLDYLLSEIQSAKTSITGGASETVQDVKDIVDNHTSQIVALQNAGVSAYIKGISEARSSSATFKDQTAGADDSFGIPQGRHYGVLAMPSNVNTPPWTPLIPNSTESFEYSAYALFNLEIYETSVANSGTKVDIQVDESSGDSILMEGKNFYIKLLSSDPRPGINGAVLLIADKEGVSTPTTDFSAWGVGRIIQQKYIAAASVPTLQDLLAYAKKADVDNKQDKTLSAPVRGQSNVEGAIGQLSTDLSTAEGKITSSEQDITSIKDQLQNVVFGSANSGKLLKVKANGTGVEYTNPSYSVIGTITETQATLQPLLKEGNIIPYKFESVENSGSSQLVDATLKVIQVNGQNTYGIATYRQNKNKVQQAFFINSGNNFAYASFFSDTSGTFDKWKDASPKKWVSKPSILNGTHTFTPDDIGKKVKISVLQGDRVVIGFINNDYGIFAFGAEDIQSSYSYMHIFRYRYVSPYNKISNFGFEYRKSDRRIEPGNSYHFVKTDDISKIEIYE